VNDPNPPRSGMQLHDAEGRRLYLTEAERRAFLQAAALAPRQARTFCAVLQATGCASARPWRSPPTASTWGRPGDRLREPQEAPPGSAR
jgi:hypothetical protein